MEKFNDIKVPLTRGYVEGRNGMVDLSALEIWGDGGVYFIDGYGKRGSNPIRGGFGSLLKEELLPLFKAVLEAQGYTVTPPDLRTNREKLIDYIWDEFQCYEESDDVDYMSEAKAALDAVSDEMLKEAYNWYDNADGSEQRWIAHEEVTRILGLED